MNTFQIITNNLRLKSENGKIKISSLSAPKSLDEFDVNIIDLSYDSIWENKGNSWDTINCISDFKSIKEMVSGTEKTIIIFALPQNTVFRYRYSYINNRRTSDYTSSVLMKDALDKLCINILPLIIPLISKIRFLSYENTDTYVGSEKYSAAFHFTHLNCSPVTSSALSQKITTIQINERIYLTTLNITPSINVAINFIKGILADKSKTAIPEWMDDICFDDDDVQLRIIDENNDIISTAEHNILEANRKLQENAKYKSILYSNGEELEIVVREIMEQITGNILDDFIDKKKEDFLIKGNGYTFIGEIKGVSDNVKRGNVSQIERHYQDYLDIIEEQGGEKNSIKKLLIINPQRLRPVTEREQINKEVINTAVKYECLIIETKTLLIMYERFRQGKLSIQDCIQLLLNNNGLLVL